MISDLMAVNDLQESRISSRARSCILPATRWRARDAAGQARARRVAGSASAAATSVRQRPSVEASGDTYTVKPGDSLYAIAATHKVKVRDLQRVNGITDAAQGQARHGAEDAGRRSCRGCISAEPQVEPHGPSLGKAGPATPRRPAAGRYTGSARSAGAPGLKVLNGDAGRQAAVADPKTMTDAGPRRRRAQPAPHRPRPAAAAAAASCAGRSRAGSCRASARAPTARHNDGVDIAVPAGTDVLAAEGGVVAYAGNEVKTYGNLVLVRHDNGWVTAYAYNDKMLVQRGDRVKRGQPIAKAGKTGARRPAAGALRSARRLQAGRSDGLSREDVRRSQSDYRFNIDAGTVAASRCPALLPFNGRYYPAAGTGVAAGQPWPYRKLGMLHRGYHRCFRRVDGNRVSHHVSAP